MFSYRRIEGKFPETLNCNTKHKFNNIVFFAQPKQTMAMIFKMFGAYSSLEKIPNEMNRKQNILLMCYGIAS